MHKNIILVGPPGSGKETISIFLREQYGYHTISGGAILRKHIQMGTELGKQFQGYVEQGDPVPAQVALDKLIKPEIEYALAHNKPFVVDGFVLSKEHMNSLLDCYKEKGILDTVCIVCLQASDQVIIDRISSRVICAVCQKSFTKKSTMCDVCGLTLVARNDQKISAQRLEKYHQQVKPIVDELCSLCSTIYINTEFALEESTRKYNQALAHIMPKTNRSSLDSVK